MVEVLAFEMEILNGVMALVLLGMLVLIQRELRGGILYRSIMPSFVGVVIFALSSLAAPLLGPEFDQYLQYTNTVVFLFFIFGAYVLYKNLKQLN